MSSDSDTDTLTFSGLDDDSTGFDAVRVNSALKPSFTPPSPAMVTVAGPTVTPMTTEDHGPVAVRVHRAHAGRGNRQSIRSHRTVYDVLVGLSVHE